MAAKRASRKLHRLLNDLPARFIIRAVGPRRDQSGTLLSFCYLRALDGVQGSAVCSFPCLSTGIFEFDQVTAADSLGAMRSWLRHRGINSPITCTMLAFNQDDDEKFSRM